MVGEFETLEEMEGRMMDERGRRIYDRQTIRAALQRLISADCTRATILDVLEYNRAKARDEGSDLADAYVEGYLDACEDTATL